MMMYVLDIDVASKTTVDDEYADARSNEEKTQTRGVESYLVANGTSNRFA